MGGACSAHWEKRSAHNFFCLKLKKKRLLGKVKCEGKYNIKMDVTQI
jgi:hypothetical protein